LAKALEGQAIGASHGFLGLITKAKIIKRYRSFEVSALPNWAAANIWTNFESMEVNMPFSKEKREWLAKTAGIAEERISEWEQSLEGLSKSLKDLGVEWKESTTPDFGSELVAITKAVGDLGSMLAAIQKAQAELAAAQTALAAAQAEQTKTFEDRVATVFTAKIASLPQGFVASESSDNLTPVQKAAPDTEWFGSMINSLEKGV
jgi:hypothetical protein